MVLYALMPIMKCEDEMLKAGKINIEAIKARNCSPIRVTICSRRAENPSILIFSNQVHMLINHQALTVRLMKSQIMSNLCPQPTTNLSY